MCKSVYISIYMYLYTYIFSAIYMHKKDVYENVYRGTISISSKLETIYLFIYFWLHPQHIAVPWPGTEPMRSSDSSHSSDDTKSLAARPSGNCQQ